MQNIQIVDETYLNPYDYSEYTSFRIQSVLCNYDEDEPEILTDIDQLDYPLSWDSDICYLISGINEVGEEEVLAIADDLESARYFLKKLYNHIEVHETKLYEEYEVNFERVNS